jgi:cysteine desulfurase/selenocysteine lyase
MMQVDRHNSVTPDAPTDFDPYDYRSDFPILNRKVNGVDLVYLDNAASTQMPQIVIDTFVEYQSNHHSNVHRGVHTLSQEATDMYESVRSKVRKLLNATSNREIVYTYGATDALNLIAHSYGRKYLQEGDEILISNMEHHANIVPWYLLAKDIGIKIKVIPITDSGEIDQDAYHALFTDRTKLVAFNHVSNALGTVNPVKEMSAYAHSKNCLTVLDGAQAIPHKKVDVQHLDVDFYVFSAHKLFGPTGLGVLYAKEHLLDSMSPFRGGGDMIRSVTFDKITFNELPYKFEAGTPAISQVIMLGAAIDYVNTIGFERINAYENSLLDYATHRISEIDGIRIIGTAREKASVLSFVMQDIHPHDIGTILDQYGIAVRSGHHCAQPVMERYGIPATTRASFAFYNTKEEVDKLIDGLHKVREVFS